MTVSVVGLGLIGGSIGLALRAAGHTVLGSDAEPKAAQVALDRQCVDALASDEDMAAAEAVFLAVPPDRVIPEAQKWLALTKENTIVTDCASVKTDIAAWALETKQTRFVGGHPMAGHEKSGAAFSSAWMFRSARWILTPVRTTKADAVRRIEQLVKEMGAVPMRIDATTHDRHVAVLSHLPHALAAVLVQLGEDLPRNDVAAGSWRDLTRVGGVDPNLWTQIFLGNRIELAKVLREFSRDLIGFAEKLEAADRTGIHQALETAAAAKARQDKALKEATARPKPPNRRRRP